MELKRKDLTSSISTKGAAIQNQWPSFESQLNRAWSQPQATVVLDTVDGVRSIYSGTMVLKLIQFKCIRDINPGHWVFRNKDGASTAIYGLRAANGVILITTKRGKQETQSKF
jgi:TonB-dependent SusC/RagA subfamily outer membrane receptor